MGNRIHAIRVGLGDTMEQFGKRLSPIATKGTISKWENGKYIPNNERLKQIAELGNVEITYLLEGEQKENVSEGIGNTRFSFEIDTKNDSFNISGFYFIQKEWLMLNGGYGLFIHFIFETSSHDFADVLKDIAKKILNNTEYPKNENGRMPIFFVEPFEKTYTVKKMGFEI